MTSAELAKLMKSGLKVSVEREEPKKHAECEDCDCDPIMGLCKVQEKLIAQLAKNPPPKVEVEVEAPSVNVAAPQVTVKVPAAPRRWKFIHTYNNRGEITETIAEAQP